MDTKKIERIDLNLLRSLEVLLEERNVTRAAARLYLSQPALSAQLARLRELFDDPLLLPTQRGMRLTAKAEGLLEPLRAALRHLRDMLEQQRDFSPATAAFTLNIASTDYAQSVAVIPLVKRLRECAPHIRVAIHHLEPAHIQTQMETGEVDVVLSSTDKLADRFYVEPLFDDGYVLISRQDHPHLHHAPTLERYLELEHVIVSLRGGGFVTEVDDKLEAMGASRRVGLSVASFLAVPAVIAQTELLALVPERLIAVQPYPLQVWQCPFPTHRFTVMMAWHERTHRHLGYRWVRQVWAELMGAPKE